MEAAHRASTGSGGAAAEEHRFEIDVHGAVPVGLVERFHRARDDDAGIVDQHVEAAEGLLGRIDGARPGGGIGDVELGSPPPPCRCRATWPAASPSMSATPTRAPCSAIISATARPMPRAAPVTRQRRPARRIIPGAAGCARIEQGTQQRQKHPMRQVPRIASADSLVEPPGNTTRSPRRNPAQPASATYSADAWAPACRPCSAPCRPGPGIRSAPGRDTRRSR
jgi:hypothetical protein